MSACDLGCFPIGGDLILICGGFSKEVDSPFLLTQHRDFHALNRVKMPPELEKRIAGESFAVTGVGMRNTAQAQTVGLGCVCSVCFLTDFGLTKS